MYTPQKSNSCYKGEVVIWAERYHHKLTMLKIETHYYISLMQLILPVMGSNNSRSQEQETKKHQLYWCQFLRFFILSKVFSASSNKEEIGNRTPLINKEVCLRRNQSFLSHTSPRPFYLSDKLTHTMDGLFGYGYHSVLEGIFAMKRKLFHKERNMRYSF